MDKPIHQHSFILNPYMNSGEQLTLKTFWFNAGGELFSTQELTLNSYSGSAKISIPQLFDIDRLEKLVGDLKKEEEKAMILSSLLGDNLLALFDES